MSIDSGAKVADPALELGKLLEVAEQPEGRAPAELFPALYRELHRLAEKLLRTQQRSSLGATTLLHEAYLELSAHQVRFPDPARFFAYAARAMRGLIVDFARSRRAQKRGGEYHITGLDTGAEERPAEDLSRLSEALDALGESDRALAELVDLKFFCGFTLREIAGMRGTSERTVQRDWSKARLYLHRFLEP
jgi:RNA polymerase sigma factor (TIGR02999 family)